MGKNPKKNYIFIHITDICNFIKFNYTLETFVSSYTKIKYKERQIAYIFV